MALDEPWDSYDRSLLPRGSSHAVGRKAVAQALRAAGARVGSLSFGPPTKSNPAVGAMLYDVYWIGDAKPNKPYQHHGESEHHRLLMRWNAVPSTSRAVLADELIQRWLPLASAWATAAPGRGNVWAASDHRWLVVLNCTRLTLIEDGPALG